MIISTRGYRADLPANFAEGLEFQLLLNLPGRCSSVEFERASVQWAKGTTFGLRLHSFLRLNGPNSGLTLIMPTTLFSD